MCDTNGVEERTTLTGLPTELTRRVCKDIGKSDILSLRAACKDLWSKVEDDFIEQHMTERRHLATQYSLEALVKITETPALIRRLSALTIVAVEAEKNDPTLLRMDDSYYRRYPHMGSHKKTVDVCSKWRKEQEKVVNGEDVRLLTVALRNLKEAGIIVALSVEDAEEHRGRGYANLDGEPEPQKPGDDGSQIFVGRRTFGYQHLGKSLGVVLKDYHLYLFRCSNEEYKLSTRLLLRSIARAQYPLVALSVCDDHLLEVELRAFSKMSTQLAESFRISLSTLKSLALAIPWLEYDRPKVQKTLTGFVSVMKNATALTKLKLSFDWDQYWDQEPYGLISEFAEAFSNAKLTDLIIQNTRMDLDDFLAFLDQHHPILERLEVNHIEFNDNVPGFKELFDVILKTTKLTHFRFAHHLMDAEGGTEPDDKRDWQTRRFWEYDGTQSVQNGLQVLRDTIHWWRN